MSTPASTGSDTHSTAVRELAELRPLLLFTAIAVPSGWVLLTLPLVTGLPLPPFVLGVNLLGLMLPALVLTARRQGRAAVGRLLRDAVRLPAPRWWLVVAIAGIPAAVWSAGATLGLARTLAPDVLLGVGLQFLSSALIINIWEELAWTGFFQRRATARWGATRGSAATAILFAGIHLPLAFAGGDPAVGVAALLITGVGLRLLIAGVDRWTGGSIFTIGLLHGSFNATAGLLEPGGDWVRLAVTLLFGVVVAIWLVRSARTVPAR